MITEELPSIRLPMEDREQREIVRLHNMVFQTIVFFIVKAV
jgi:hypothetical protein